MDDDEKIAVSAMVFAAVPAALGATLLGYGTALAFGLDGPAAATLASVTALFAFVPFLVVVTVAFLLGYIVAFEAGR